MRRLILVATVLVWMADSLMSQSNHQISIDGINNDWTADETFTTISGADHAYFTWDADYLYFGIAHAEADYDNMATFMYFNTETGGTVDAYAWGNTITTPFLCNYVVVWKNQTGNDYIEIQHWTGSAWEQTSSSNSSTANKGRINFSIGVDYREMKIVRSYIGDPTSIKWCSFTEQQWGSYYRYFTFPNNNWTDANRAASQSIPSYYGYNLITGISPNSAGALDGVLPVEITSFSIATRGRGASLSWSTATELQNVGFDIERTDAAEKSWSKIGFVEGAGSTNKPQSYSFTDNSVAPGKYAYRLKQIDRDGKYEYSKEVEVSVSAPTMFALSQNYPNPFNPTTIISFTVPVTGHATLKVVNTLGQEVATLFNGEAQSGIENKVHFDASGYASGMYFSRLEQNGKIQMTKMSLIK